MSISNSNSPTKDANQPSPPPTAHPAKRNLRLAPTTNQPQPPLSNLTPATNLTQVTPTQEATQAQTPNPQPAPQNRVSAALRQPIPQNGISTPTTSQPSRLAGSELRSDNLQKTKNTPILNLAGKYKINTSKDNFPLNTLRLFYLSFTETWGNSDSITQRQRAEQILNLIPHVQAVLDARTKHRTANTSSTPQTEWEAIQEPLEKIYELIDTPRIRQAFEYLIFYVFPLQDTQLFTLYQNLSSEKKFTIQDIYSTLAIRAMDSIIYSSIVAELTFQNLSPESSVLSSQIHLQVNIAYQINDMIDAIVFAKQDLESGNFSIFEIIKKTATSSDEAKTMIRNVLDSLQQKAAIENLPPATKVLIEDFYKKLVGVIG